MISLFPIRHFLLPEFSSFLLLLLVFPDGSNAAGAAGLLANVAKNVAKVAPTVLNTLTGPQQPMGQQNPNGQYDQQNPNGQYGQQNPNGQPGMGQKLKNGLNTAAQLLNTIPGGTHPNGQPNAMNKLKNALNTGSQLLNGVMPSNGQGNQQNEQQQQHHNGQQHTDDDDDDDGEEGQKNGESDLTNEVVEKDNDDDDDDDDNGHSQHGGGKTQRTNERNRKGNTRNKNNNNNSGRDDDDANDDDDDNDNRNKNDDDDGYEGDDEDDDDRESRSSRKRKKHNRRKGTKKGSKRHKSSAHSRKKKKKIFFGKFRRSRYSSVSVEESYRSADAHPIRETNHHERAIVKANSDSGVCEDLDHDICRRKHHLCSLDDYERDMHNQCPVTCLVCKKGAHRPSYKEHSQARGCHDADEPDCMRAAGLGYCSEKLFPDYKEFMVEKCSIACGKCSAHLGRRKRK